MRYRNVLLPAAAIAVTATMTLTSAQAQSSGNYIGAGVGISLQRDAHITGTGIGTSADTDSGLAGQLSIGHAYGNNMRAEVEAAYRKSSVDSLTGISDAGGAINAFSGMVNGYYDFSTDSAFTPYLGAGIGLARIGYSNVTPVGGSRINDHDTAFAYQAIAGVAYDLGDGLSMTADYRHFRTATPGFRTDSGVSIDSQFRENRVMVGLRWSFGAPAVMPEPAPAVIPVAQPAPAPAPAPVPVVEKPAPVVPRTYLVFFDWSRTELRPDTLAIVREAAANASKISVARIVATGHADRSGSDAFNMRLSKRRAQSVMDELVRLGVPANEIEILWKGERDLLVPTGDGVREPQNRRVEIVFE